MNKKEEVAMFATAGVIAVQVAYVAGRSALYIKNLIKK